MALSPESSADISQFFASIKSLNELDRLEVRNLVNGGLIGAPSNRENYFLLNYNRAVLSIELLLTLTDYKHFQTVANISRSMFEIAVEMWMMQRDNDSPEKITAFIEYEKLRAARKIIKYGLRDSGKAGLVWIYMDFIRQNGNRIDAEQQRIWPGKKRSAIGP